MNLTQIILDKAKALQATGRAGNTYCYRDGSVKLEFYAGRGNPNGYLIRWNHENHTDADWEARRVHVTKFLQGA